MTGDTVECFNCGHANPSWAQVCRQCGFTLQADGATSGAPRGILPTDRRSLIAIGASMGAIVLAIMLGLFVSGLIPEVAAEPTPSPTPSTAATASALPSAGGSFPASAAASQGLPGTIAFGTGWDNTARQITGATSAFTAASAGFAHSITLSAPIGVDRLQEEVVRVAADGKETVVQPRVDGVVLVNPALASDGLKFASSVTKLIAKWGTGTFIMRVYRGLDLLAEGSFTLS